MTEIKQYQDQFGKPIQEGIKYIKEIEVTNTQPMDIEAIEPDAYGFTVKRLDINAKIKINDRAGFTIDEGDRITFVDTIDLIQIETAEAIGNPIVIQLLV